MMSDADPQNRDLWAGAGPDSEPHQPGSPSGHLIDIDRIRGESAEAALVGDNARSMGENQEAIAAQAERDPQAGAYLREHGAETVADCFAIGNILHTNRCVTEAATFYRRAFDLHDKNPGHYPQAQSLLQVRLLCLLKAGLRAPEAELAELAALNAPYAQYIRGVQLAWRDQNFRKAAETIGNAYEEFHTGEEIDTLYQEIGMSIPGFEPFVSAPAGERRIPDTLYFYWDKNPPEEIRNNFERHRAIRNFNVKIFDREEAASWLYDYYGIEARELFLNARHPAEAADFLRVHVINMLGGWWLDADIALKDVNALSFLRERPSDTVLLLTHNRVVHNDFFGSIANAEILNDCLLSLYRNCYLHRGLFIGFKTGPGVFNRALSRYIHRRLAGVPTGSTVEVYGQDKFNDLIVEFDTPYKSILPSWHAV